jgi:hypothetical protein
MQCSLSPQAYERTVGLMCTGVLISPYPALFPFQLFFSVRGTGGSQTGPDPENRVGDQDIGSPGTPVSSGLQMPGEPFPSWSG